jgi:hypothetical protein
MSQPNSSPGIYDGLMMVSLAAVILAITLLVMTLSSYS